MASLYKNNLLHIFVLVIILVLLFAFMTKLKQGSFFGVSPQMPEFTEPAKIIDNTFYHKQHRFSVSIPNRRWELTWSAARDSLLKHDPVRPLFETTNWLVKLFQRHGSDSLAVIQIGILRLDQQRSSQQLAKQSLDELRSYYVPPDTIRIIKDVTSSGTSRQQAAYYMIGLPENIYVPYPYLITMIVVQNHLAYATRCQVRSQSYELLKPELETILRSFRVY
ncbi:MAG: hypothetical protein ONB31_01845 [candidate division KSB1 bacterium]|nr:hypothetical protein [candidate division KSB1 bacterium]MDZ7334296.1 hypothetical protein [candidate division KSB1 bacterium]MDZ7356486.1 hypothetical protein [candidate division KSB1 bacterium]MDZ7400493.1 hypothetical protein [candidate division KSB1 bacterium]